MNSFKKSLQKVVPGKSSEAKVGWNNEAKLVVAGNKIIAINEARKPEPTQDYRSASIKYYLDEDDQSLFEITKKYIRGSSNNEHMINIIRAYYGVFLELKPLNNNVLIAISPGSAKSPVDIIGIDSEESITAEKSPSRLRCDNDLKDAVKDIAHWLKCKNERLVVRHCVRVMSLLLNLRSNGYVFEKVRQQSSGKRKTGFNIECADVFYASDPELLL